MVMGRDPPFSRHSVRMCMTVLGYYSPAVAVAGDKRTGPESGALMDRE